MYNLLICLNQYPGLQAFSQPMKLLLLLFVQMCVCVCVCVFVCVPVEDATTCVLYLTLEFLENSFGGSEEGKEGERGREGGREKREGGRKGREGRRERGR